MQSRSAFDKARKHFVIRHLSFDLSCFAALTNDFPLRIVECQLVFQDVLMSRRAIRYMNTVFRDATSADLAASSDTVCIICREEMQASSGTGQQNPSAVLKRLPCSHIFHVSCLRSWFQRQQTCPTCRMDIIRQVRLQENQAQGRGQASRAAAAGSGNGASAPASANSETQAESGAAARPPWMVCRSHGDLVDFFHQF